MNKSDIKQLFQEGIVALLVLLPPIFLLFMMPQFVFSLWMTGLLILVFKKRQNPEIRNESKIYRTIERLLYFQIINWSFGFFFIPVMGVIALIIPAVILLLATNKERRANPIFIKWAKYVGFHIFNLVLVLNLLHFAPNIGVLEEALLVLSMIAFVNGGNAVIYLKIEPRVPRGRKRAIALLIILALMISMAISMFPQYGGGSVLGAIFGG